MTAFQAIQRALRPFGWPAVPYVYGGKEKRYFTYNYADNHGDDFGNDIPGSVVVGVQVHMYLPITDPSTGNKTNFIQDQKTARDALFHAGFTYPAVTIRREDETECWHITFECEFEEDPDVEAQD